MEKKLFSNSVFSPVIIGSPIGFGANGDKHYEVVFSLAIVWMDGDDWLVIWEIRALVFPTEQPLFPPEFSLLKAFGL